ncbi:MAG: hypothetical protein CVU91_13195 [Firmicutes bacterium HGW-Firmicutes-16]|nr:MAG: hypothetical protein CVU91_13195 [Firmicutes bacterium HGW-Firmicutes-16]
MGDAAGEAAGLGETCPVGAGLSPVVGEGIAGLCETTGTFGLTVGVVSVFLQPPSIARIIRANVMIAVAFFIF